MVFLMSGLVLVGVFAAGALFGAGLVRWRGSSETAARPLPLPPGGGPIEAIKIQLGLDAAQIAALDEIVRSHRDELEQIGRETQMHVRKTLFAIEDELVANLRPDQVEKLETWRKTRRPPPMGHPPGGFRPPH